MNENENNQEPTTPQPAPPIQPEYGQYLPPQDPYQTADQQPPKPTTVTIHKRTVAIAAAAAAVVLIAASTATWFAGRQSMTQSITAAQQQASQWKKKYEDEQKLYDTLRSTLADNYDEQENTEEDPQQDSNGSSDNAAIGETQTNGTLAMTLKSVEEIPSVPQVWNGQQPDLTPANGTKFISVNVDLTNNGKEPVDITCSYVVDIRLVNPDNQQYTPIDDLFKIPGNPECNAELQPGLTSSVNYVFNVPSDANIIGVLWRDVTDLWADTEYTAFMLDSRYTYG